MLFNSYEYILVFLPIAVLGYFALGRCASQRAVMLWLTFMSLVFYGYWNPKYLALLGFSVAFNFMAGRAMQEQPRTPGGRALLVLGICVNLSLLGYYKYFGFILGTVNGMLDMSMPIPSIVLPLAISFFTFQQITFLVDSYLGNANERSFVRYCTFVTFFPQLIAGPIVHHSEMLPQFARSGTFRRKNMNIAIGVSLFAIGLVKKTVLADGIAAYATPVFVKADSGVPLEFLEAWGGALAYTFQLYFDFSGYSDMALGAARLFGIRLPMNFYSPYKASSIIEFWRRWHMTLSRFLRDYLYIPLGGSRHGPARRHLNLLVTMLLGGLWHGAGWTFVAWGGLHGAYLVANHGWRALSRRFLGRFTSTRLTRLVAWLLTFLAVVVGWVMFRATTFSGASQVLAGMSGANGLSLPQGILVRLGDVGDALRALGIQAGHGGGTVLLKTYGWIALCLLISTTMPNSVDLMRRFRPCFEAVSRWPGGAQSLRGPRVLVRLAWRPSLGWALVIACFSVAGLLSLSQVSEFLYFQF